MDAIDLFYRQYSGVETANYFAFRFGQPRHLAALSLASLLQPTTGPILDVACGLGHLTHAFAQAHPGRTVIGLDRDFFRLYVASQFVAPEASYICAPADQPLPFAEKTFGGIFCSDAFHYFLQRAASVREFQRQLASDGVLILCRFGNVEVEPREGYELSIEGYRSLLGGWPHVMLGEEDLVERYLEKRGPDLAMRGGPAELRKQKWLSLVAARSLDRVKTEQRFATWPHALGRLQLNPIYLEDSSQPGGETALRFEFPSSWYEFENQRYLGYAPRQARITHEAWAALKEGRPSPALQEYIDQFVILGMPERYSSPKIQPTSAT
jgi:SAM-dependent methyltransferase